MSDSEITTYHLEMCDRGAFQPSSSKSGFVVEGVEPSDHQVSRGLYIKVGKVWGWTDRLNWSDEKWRNVVCSDGYRTYLARLNGKLVGYFELESQEGGDVEIVYFGLLAECIGEGLGGVLLSQAVNLAWSLPETRRVWVHTCTKDHEHALENYRNRGFTVLKKEQGGEVA